VYRLRAIVKRCLAYCLYWSGLLWLIARWRLRNRAVVLTYHRVLPPDADSFSDSGIRVTPGTFAANLRFLSRHFAPLSADEFLKCLARGGFPRGACLVTFDDGWFDNERYAFPILQERKVPAVFFVATGYIGSEDVFWQERLTRQLYMLSRHADAGAQVLAELGLEESRLADDATARMVVRSCVTRLKSLESIDLDRIRTAATDACLAAGIDVTSLGDDRFMDWDAVSRAASSDLVAIASHAHSHSPLTRLGPEKATEDLRRSLIELSLRGIAAPPFCAYPNGDFDSTVIDSLRRADLEIGFTTEHGFVGVESDRGRLPRVNLHENAARTPPEFLCRILGVF
jgi:peptidoglycan/xylan/chitin deacetylase (PgdA/CDA1 family)